jgi:hypothetical protein
VAGFRCLDRVHRQRTDRVGHVCQRGRIACHTRVNVLLHIEALRARAPVRVDSDKSPPLWFPCLPASRTRGPELRAIGP